MDYRRAGIFTCDVTLFLEVYRRHYHLLPTARPFVIRGLVEEGFRP